MLAFRSCDQGWSSEPDGGSWSWFEAGLAQLPAAERYEPGGAEEEGGSGNDVDVWTRCDDWTSELTEQIRECRESQPKYKIQTNRHAEKQPENYAIELTGEHEMVQRIQAGDRIVLWACACFPGWRNRVFEAEISVLGMDDLMT